MKKYLRTNDGIFEVAFNREGKPIDEDKTWILTNRVRYYNSISCYVCKKDIIGKANTIEELVDEYVVIRDNTKINQLVRTDDTKYLKELIKEDKRIIEIKGAIWTDKGLIYVAKMNEKGELELI